MSADSVKPRNPDPQEFGRKVLWNLCGMRAEMRILLQVFSKHITPDLKEADAIYAGWITQALATQRKFYDEALEAVGIPQAKDQG
jgi:hypothetical protein